MKGMKKLELKYTAKKLLSRFKPTRKFSYKYKPFSVRRRTKEFVVTRNKQISIISIVVFLLFFSFLITNTVTGYITYQKNIETELNDTKNTLSATQTELSTVSAAKQACDNNLQAKQAEVNTCNDKLAQSRSYLVDCETERDNLKTYSEELNALFATCDEERAVLQTNYDEISLQFDQLVQKTAFDVCCRPGIEVGDWAVVANRIVCSGDLTVNCTSGETSY